MSWIFLLLQFADLFMLLFVGRLLLYNWFAWKRSWNKVQKQERFIAVNIYLTSQLKWINPWHIRSVKIRKFIRSALTFNCSNILFKLWLDINTWRRLLGHFALLRFRGRRVGCCHHLFGEHWLCWFTRQNFLVYLFIVLLNLLLL